MKFSVPPNSLFAVLLRSPFWISFAIAIAITLPMLALLPTQYAIVGVCGTTPFYAIGFIAMFKQWRTPDTAQIQTMLEHAVQLNARDLDRRITQALEMNGMQKVESSHCSGADLSWIDRDGKRTLLASRRWKAAKHGIEPLRALIQAKTQSDAENCIYIAAANSLSPQAYAYAKKEGIQIMPPHDLAALLLKTGTDKIASKA